MPRATVDSTVTCIMSTKAWILMLHFVDNSHTMKCEWKKEERKGEKMELNIRPSPEHTLHCRKRKEKKNFVLREAQIHRRRGLTMVNNGS